jgi:IclR family transcriptional regulator, acetate operon repressor
LHQVQPGADDVLLRAVRVLETLAGMEQPAPLAAVAERTGLPRTKAYRALRALERDGFVGHVGRAGYRTSGRSLSLALLLGPRPILRQRAISVLTRLSAATSTTSTLYMRSGEHRVLLLATPPPYGPRLEAVLGERAPLTSGCVGKAILAFLPSETRSALVENSPRSVPRPTPDELDGIVEQGYAISRNVNHVGVSGVAAPLLDPSGAGPLGSLCLAGPTGDLTDADLYELSRPLIAACAELAPRLATLIGQDGWIRQEALDIGMLPDIEM